jgi:hypothetical protein
MRQDIAWPVHVEYLAARTFSKAAARFARAIVWRFKSFAAVLARWSYEHEGERYPRDDKRQLCELCFAT